MPAPHVVSIESGSRYLDQMEELFALLEKGEPGEIEMEYSRFLVVEGEISRELSEALPPYTYVGLVPGKKLLVFKVLNEDLESVRSAWAQHSHAPNK